MMYVAIKHLIGNLSKRLSQGYSFHCRKHFNSCTLVKKGVLILKMGVASMYKAFRNKSGLWSVWNNIGFVRVIRKYQVSLKLI